MPHGSGADAWGGGEAPGLYDVSNISDSDLPQIVPLAVLAIGIVLALVLRSLVAPLYLIASVGLSYLAALGLIHARVRRAREFSRDVFHPTVPDVHLPARPR